MDKKPKKTRAFIITFILVIIFLIFGYWLFSNKGKIFGTREINLGKIFEPLLGTRDKIGLDVTSDKKGEEEQGPDTSSAWTPPDGWTYDPNTGAWTPPDGWTYDPNTGAWNPPDGWTYDPNTGGWTPPDGWTYDPNTGGWTRDYKYQCSDGIDNDGDGLIDDKDPGCYKKGDVSIASDYDPTDNSEWDVLPTPGEGNDNIDREGITKPQCSDGIDNDGDGLIDRDDPGCHTDFDASNSASYDPNLNNENLESIAGVKPNQCRVFDDYALEFTDSERARLAELLRKFYLIAPTLKSEDDISLVYSEIDRYRTFVSQLEGLIKQCYLQTNRDDRKVNMSYGYVAFCNNNKGVCERNQDESLKFTKYDADDNLVSIFNEKYTGPTTIYGNPWFKQFDRGSYIPSGEINKYKSIRLNISSSKEHKTVIIHEKDFETLLNIW